ncbi:hypothetical protein PGB90_007088 [Kerria lacca]
MDENENLTPAHVTWSIGELIPEIADQIQCEVLTQNIHSKRIENIIALKDNNVFLGKRDNSQLCKNFIAVRNKETKAVRWYPVDNFFMKSYQPKKNRNLEIQENEGFKEAAINLNKNMGSKKSKTRINMFEKNVRQFSNIIKPIKKAIKKNNLIVDTEVNLNPTIAVTYLPPCNRNANIVQDIYKIDDLISEEIMQSLEEYACGIMQTDILKIAADSKLSPFFLKGIALYPKNLVNVKLLLFVDNLLKFIKEPARVIKSKTHIFCPYSDAINKKILDEFCIIGVNGIRNRPPSMCDKALCYVLTILLILGDFTVDISILSGIVKTTYYNRLPTLMKALGAQSRRNSAVIFTLKLPLVQLPLSTRKKYSI